MRRREFIALTGAAGAGVLAGGACVAAAPGIAHYTLQCGFVDRIIDGRRTRLRAYNASIPGPLIEARAGQRIRIRLHNALTPYDSRAWTGDHNVPHAFDTTNLHVHGLEVIPHLFEPLGTADPLARMIAVRPDESKFYDFALPADHSPGLYWYHPHHHGSTAVQAASGMAGLIVIRGDIDDVPEIRAAREELLLISDIGLFPSETDPDVWTYDPVQNATWNTMASRVERWDPVSRSMLPAPELRGGFSTGDYALRYLMVNGQPYYREEHNSASPRDPTGTQLAPQRITMRPGEVLRVRMLNANSDMLMPIAVDRHALHLLALDGVNFGAPRLLPPVPPDGSTGQLLLAPSNRAEFLIRAGAPGTYPIVQLAQSQQFLHSPRKTIAEIIVAGDPIAPPMPIPATLPLPRRHYPLIRADEVGKRRNITLSAGFPAQLNPIIGMDFMLNNALYDERAVDTVVDLGSVEEWVLRVPDADHGGNEGHPFHIHVNSFEVVSIGGRAEPEGTIMDTIWVPAGSDVVIRMRFRSFTGKSVYHCHILPHEDTGMMQNFLIVPHQP